MFLLSSLEGKKTLMFSCFMAGFSEIIALKIEVIVHYVTKATREVIKILTGDVAVRSYVLTHMFLPQKYEKCKSFEFGKFQIKGQINTNAHVISIRLRINWEFVSPFLLFVTFFQN